MYSEVYRKSHSIDILEVLLCTDVLLYCTEYQELSISSELVQVLLRQMTSTADNTILNLITHIIHLHCLFPSRFLLTKPASWSTKPRSS